MTTERETATKPESERQQMSPTTTDELSQVNQATPALVDTSIEKKSELLLAREIESRMKKRTYTLLKRGFLIFLALAVLLLFSVPTPVL